MPRRVLPLLVVLLALPGAPVASAQEAGSSAVCFGLAVHGPDGDLLSNHQESCEAAEELLLNLTLRDRGLSGILRFSMRVMVQYEEPTSPNAPGDPSEVTVPLSLRPQAPEPSTEAFRVTVFVNATFGEDCRPAYGDVHVTYDHRSLQEVPFSGALPLCPDLGVPGEPEALAALRDLARDLEMETPSVAEALADLLDRVPGPKPEPASEPAPRPEGTDADADLGGADEPEPDEAPLSTSSRVDAGGDPDEGAADASMDHEVRTQDATLVVDAGAQAPPLPAPAPAADAALPAAAPVEGEQADARLPVEAEPPRRAPPVEAADPPARLAAPDVALAPWSPPARPEARPTGEAPPEEPPTRAAVAVVAAASAAGGAALLFVAWVLFQRIARPKALDHPARQRLHAACLATLTGGTVRELADAAGVTTRDADYHLRYLARLSLLRVDEVPGAPRRYAPPASPRPVEQAPWESRVVPLVRERPGVGARELAEALGVAYGRVDRHLKDLLCQGAVESRVAEGRRGYYPAATSTSRAPDSLTGTRVTSP